MTGKRVLRAMSLNSFCVPRQPSFHKVVLEVETIDAASYWLGPAGYFISVDVGVKKSGFFFFLIYLL